MTFQNQLFDELFRIDYEPVLAYGDRLVKKKFG